MRIERIEDMVVWQEARLLVSDIYQTFRLIKDYGFRDQIQRASISVMNNIAEGFERKGDKELRKFLFIAKGSCGEVRSMIYAALDLGYISKEDFNRIYEKSDCISRKLATFINKLSF